VPVESVCALFEVNPEWNTENICAAIKTVKAYGAYTESGRSDVVRCPNNRVTITEEHTSP
jgi:hypothetical protein